VRAVDERVLDARLRALALVDELVALGRRRRSGRLGEEPVRTPSPA
jgi:hypothetical protein